MHLSPSVYLEKFDKLVHDRSETFSQFSTRLMSLCDYYAESRLIGQRYEKLVDLMIYDRIQRDLPFSLARHVLTLEAALRDGWLGRLGLVEV